jgi:hypothetical protein
MADYEVTYIFNVRRVLRQEISADTDEEAIAIARRDAEQTIDTELVALTNTTGWTDADTLDPAMFLDRLDETHVVVLVEETLSEPTP